MSRRVFPEPGGRAGGGRSFLAPLRSRVCVVALGDQHQRDDVRFSSKLAWWCVSRPSRVSWECRNPSCFAPRYPPGKKERPGCVQNLSLIKGRAGPFGFRPAPSGHKQVLRHARLLRYGRALGGRGLDALRPILATDWPVACRRDLGKVQCKVPRCSARCLLVPPGCPPGRPDQFRGCFSPKKVPTKVR